MVHYAYYAVKKWDGYLLQPQKIMVFPTQLRNYNCIAPGTTKTSIAKFWAGVGALKRLGGGYIETVLSPSQVEAVETKWELMSIKGLQGKNFKKLRIIEN